MAKIMNARPTSLLPWLDPDAFEQPTKYPTDGRAIQRPAPDRDEQQFVLGSDMPAILDITIKASYCSVMKRDTPTLLELCFSDKKRVRVEVIKLKSEGFRNSQSSNV
jgi:hypothetical protein